LLSSLSFHPPCARPHHGASVQPSSLIAASFLVFILLGAGLLLLPRATAAGAIAPVDALFTAASAVCVTGLTVVDTATAFTPTGHVILLLLIQVGGLGIMTLTTFFAFAVGSRGSLKQYSTLQSLLGEESIGKIRTVVLQIGLTTLLIELPERSQSVLGGWPGFASQRDRMFFALFHSVSAFCNASSRWRLRSGCRTLTQYRIPFEHHGTIVLRLRLSGAAQHYG
jgi:Trk-type K+ transport system membrane component